MEVYVYQALLLREKGKSKKEIRKIFSKREYDFLQGVYTFEGAPQKAFYQFEIEWRLKKAGFKKIKIDKVLYSWKEFKEAGQGFFPKEENPWDWYVVCEK